MMRRLLGEKRSIAIVVDEFRRHSRNGDPPRRPRKRYSGISGDEHDKSGLTARTISPGVYEFSDATETSMLNENYLPRNT